MLSTFNHKLTHFINSCLFCIQTDDYSLHQALHKECFVLLQTCSLGLLTPIIASIVYKYQKQAEVFLSFSTYVFISTAGSFVVQNGGGTSRACKLAADYSLLEDKFHMWRASNILLPPNAKWQLNSSSVGMNNTMNITGSPVNGHLPAPFRNLQINLPAIDKKWRILLVQRQRVMFLPFMDIFYFLAETLCPDIEHEIILSLELRNRSLCEEPMSYIICNVVLHTLFQRITIGSALGCLIAVSSCEKTLGFWELGLTAWKIIEGWLRTEFAYSGLRVGRRLLMCPDNWNI